MSEATQPEGIQRVNRRKVREGTVVSTKMEKTVVVVVVDRVRHRRYQKTLQRTTRLYAHDEVNDLKEGDRVRVQETRPTSKLKRWRGIEVLERARGRDDPAGEPPQGRRHLRRQDRPLYQGPGRDQAPLRHHRRRLRGHREGRHPRGGGEEGRGREVRRRPDRQGKASARRQLHSF